jgi:hypothetical protein
MHSDQYLGAREAAAFLGISLSKLNKARVSGDGPAYFRPPGLRRILYRREDLTAWVEQGRRVSTSAAHVPQRKVLANSASVRQPQKQLLQQATSLAGSDWEQFATTLPNLGR